VNDLAVAVVEVTIDCLSFLLQTTVNDLVVQIAAAVAVAVAVAVVEVTIGYYPSFLRKKTTHKANPPPLNTTATTKTRIWMMSVVFVALVVVAHIAPVVHIHGHSHIPVHIHILVRIVIVTVNTVEA